jgi:hypothetical protein
VVPNEKRRRKSRILLNVKNSLFSLRAFFANTFDEYDENL